MSVKDTTRNTQRSNRHKNHRTIFLRLAGLLLVPAAGVIKASYSLGNGWLLVMGVVVSAVTFLIYWSDKNKARTGQWRTPETTLHVLGLLGGWPGAFVAQQMFRHKTKKRSFRIVFWLIVVIHQVGWLDYLLADGRGLLHIAQMILAAAHY